MTPASWAGRRVFLTGHTGFKGSWACLQLAERGAQVTGYALPPPSEPSLFDQANVAARVRHIGGDVLDLAALKAAIADAAPELVVHMAAQSLVRRSYAEPVETFAVNVMGTANLLEACRGVPSVRAIICVTSDKCYENREWVWPYRESDALGGHDPYSASKGAAEIVIAACRRSFFGDGGALVASVRAGNVIGGGDWAEDRLLPDIARALAGGRRPFIRNPDAIRPWQHVLDALSGYWLVAERLLGGDRAAADGWNFGPSEEDARPVRWIADAAVRVWGTDGWDSGVIGQAHEAHTLKLDCAKARTLLGWRPALDLTAALGETIAWYKAWASGGDPAQLCAAQIATYDRKRSGRDV